MITHNYAPESLGLLWTSDQSVAETSTWQHPTLTTDKHPCPGGIRTHNISRRAAEDLRLRSRGHWDRHTVNSKSRNFKLPILPIFNIKIQLSAFSAYLDGWLSQLIGINGVVLYFIALIMFGEEYNYEAPLCAFFPIVMVFFSLSVLSSLNLLFVSYMSLEKSAKNTLCEKRLCFSATLTVLGCNKLLELQCLWKKNWVWRSCKRDWGNAVSLSSSNWFGWHILWKAAVCYRDHSRL